jgi:hypothetical protein
MAYTARVSRKLVTVAETPLFMRQAKEVWAAEEYEAFVEFIARNPEAGDVVPETGGVRKNTLGQGWQRQARRNARDLLLPR